MKNLKFFFFTFFLLFIFGCKKDEVPSSPNIESSGIPISEYKNWYSSKRKSASRSEFTMDGLTSLSLTPDWQFAQKTYFSGSIPMFSVPILEPLGDSLPDGTVSRLLFFKDESDAINVQLLCFLPTSEYLASHDQGFDMADFSGAAFGVDEEGCFSFNTVIKDGKCIALCTGQSPNGLVQTKIEERDDPKCGNYKDTFLHKWRSFWSLNWINDVFGGLFNGSGSSSGGSAGSGSLGVYWVLPYTDPGHFTPLGYGAWSNLTDDLLDEMFDNLLWEQAPFHEFQAGCDANTWNGDNMPLVLLTQNFRALDGYQSGLGTPWGLGMVDCLNQYLLGIQNGTPRTFSDILSNHDINSSVEPNSPLSSLNPVVSSAVVSAFKKMTDRYAVCFNQMEAGNAYEGDFVFDYNPGDFCECLGNYSAEDALSDILYDLNIGVAQSLIDEFGMFGSPSDIISALQNECGFSGSQEQLFLQLDALHGDLDNLPECFKEIITQDRIIFLNEQGFSTDWLTNQELDWLASNFNSASELVDFLNLHSVDENQTNQTKAVLKAYINMLMNPSSELAQLIQDFENSSFGDPLWEILKDQLAEALTALIADLIPGGTIITIGPELLDNLSQGNFLDALWNAVDIALNEADTFIPAAKVASFSINLVVIVDKMADFYKVLDKMKPLGDQILLPLYRVLRNKIDDLSTNLKYVGGNTGATLTNVDPLDLWVDIQEIFEGLGAQVLLPNQLQPQELFGVKMPDGSRIVLKYGGNTNPDGYTLEIHHRSGFTFKIRIL